MKKHIFKSFYGVIVWFIASVFVVYSFCLNTAGAVFSDSIQASLHATNVQMSIAYGAFILGFALMQIPAGFFLDKYNAKYVVSIGIMLLAIGNIAISFADNLVFYSFSNFIQGVGASFSFVAAAILISQWFARKLFPILFGLTQSAACILTSIIHYCFTMGLKTYSWHELYQVIALFGIVLFIFSIVFIRSKENNLPQKTLSLKKSLRQVFSNRQILLCTLAGATSFGVLLAYAGFWYLQVQKHYKVENFDSIIISGAIFMGVGIGTPIMAWYSNRIKSRMKVIHQTLILGAMLLLLALYFPHFEVHGLIIIKLISFLLGFFLSGSTLFYTMVSEFSSVNIRGVALSVLNMTVFLYNTLLLFIPYLFVTEVSKEFFTYLWIMPFSILFSILILYSINDSYSFQHK